MYYFPQKKKDSPMPLYIRIRKVSLLDDERGGKYLKCSCNLPCQLCIPCPHIFKVTGATHPAMHHVRWWDKYAYYTRKGEFHRVSKSFLDAASGYSSLGGSIPVNEVIDLTWTVAEKLSEDKMEQVLKFEAGTYDIANEVWLDDCSDLQPIYTSFLETSLVIQDDNFGETENIETVLGTNEQRYHVMKAKFEELTKYSVEDENIFNIIMTRLNSNVHEALQLYVTKYPKVQQPRGSLVSLPAVDKRRKSFRVKEVFER